MTPSLCRNWRTCETLRDFISLSRFTFTFTAVAAQRCIGIKINSNCFTIVDQGKRNARTTISYECKNNISN